MRYTPQIDIGSLFLQSFLKGIPVFISTAWPLLVILAVMSVIRIAIWFYHYQRFSKAGMFEIDKMNGSDFEERLAILFTHLGYRVTRTGKPSGDYGVDLVVEQNGRRIAVQAKCYHGSVGEDAIREVFSGKNYYHCGEAMVVTNSTFTKMAWRLAESNHVKLWNRNYLTKVLLTEKERQQ